MDKQSAETLRLQVYMARSGVGSRRKCEEYIALGFVKVNGVTVTEKGYKVQKDDRITYRGKLLYPTRKLIYLALHKPPMYICSNSDPEGRNLAVDLLKGEFPVRLYNVGRLDYLSTGLIFFTNDGNFSKIVSHPSSGIEKEYIVETKQEIKKEILEEFVKGAWVEGVFYKIVSYIYKTPFKVKLVLQEGKNREIRRFFQARRLKIKKLHRVRIGIVNLGNIPMGGYRYLSEKEVNWFLKERKKNRG